MYDIVIRSVEPVSQVDVLRVQGVIMIYSEIVAEEAGDVREKQIGFSRFMDPNSTPCNQSPGRDFRLRWSRIHYGNTFGMSLELSLLCWAVIELGIVVR